MLLLILDSFCLLISLSYYFVLQTLMQKFLSLGNECVKIQETADASQGMFIIISNSLLLHSCLFCFLLVTECPLSPFCCTVVALTLAHACILAPEAKLKASQQAWESATAAKVSAEKAAKATEAKAKKAEKAMSDAE
jgi:hypothetical protein